MVISVVIDPEVFVAEHFAIPGYRENAEVLLRGIEDNGFLYVDPHAILLRRMRDRILRLPIKQGQQLRIRFEELEKKIGRRIVIASREECLCKTSDSNAIMVAAVGTGVDADAAVSIGDAISHLLDAGLEEQLVVSMDRYLGSSLESMRHEFCQRLPTIDEFTVLRMEELLGRVLRPTSFVRIFDKQIGSGERLGRFRAGISLVMRAWRKVSPRAAADCRLEIVTCRKPTHDPTEVVYRRLCDNLGRRLFREFSVPVHVLLKEDDPAVTHDRYLETDSFSLSFSRGLDIVRDEETLECCTVRIEGNVDRHLCRYASLDDAFDPVSFT